MGLMRSQNNVLFERVAESGLETSDFGLDDQGSATYVRHLPSGSAFSISSHDGISFYGSAKVGDAGWYPYESSEWQLLIIDHFGRWLRAVKLEIDAPDKWAILREANQFLGELARAELSNTPFTPAEQSHISAKLDEIKTYLTESRSLTEAQAESIRKKIDHADEASRRLGRKDWIVLFLGALISVVLSVVLPPQEVEHVILMAARDLGHLFGGGQHILPPQA